VTYYIKIEINHPSELLSYDTQGFAPGCAICRPAARTVDFVTGTGTYFIPLERQCVSGVVDKFVIGPGQLGVPSGKIETASCSGGVDTWTFIRDTGYVFNRRSGIENQLLDITANGLPLDSIPQLRSINIANLDLCGASPVLSGSITWDSTTIILPNAPGGNIGDPCASSITHNFEPLLWEVVPGVV
jgi:hypothetical protein